MTDRTDAGELIADGAGRPEAGDDADETRMRDVSHTPPNGDGTNDVWARGEGDAVRSRDDDE